jgi:peptide/nickel transport system substrate-binding protein
VYIRVSGQYQDTLLHAADGREIMRGAVRPNIIVYRSLDLIGGLLGNQGSLQGILYWAVGSGDESWDAEAPVPERTTLRLVNETFRKRVDPVQDISYDRETQTLVVQVRLEAGEVTGTLREFGLFGGDASPMPNSGYLINHVIHPAVEMDDESVHQRELRLSFSAEQAPTSLVDLIAGLLSNEPLLSGIQHVAVGAGDPEWDEAPPETDESIDRLVREVHREPVRPYRDVSYHEDIRTLTVRTALDFDVATGEVREFALYGGDSTLETNSGRLVSYQVVPVIDRTLPVTLEREFRISLGSEVVVEVPNLIGQILADARAALIDAQLIPGAIREIESSDEPDLVIEQDPEPGTLVAEGSVVDIGFSVRDRIVVPDMRGLTIEQAVGVLQDAGLALDDEEPLAEEHRASPGTIIRQFPEAGNRVDAGSVISVVVARPITTEVPDLTGSTVGGASVLLRKAGLALAAPPYPVRGSEQIYDTVVDQDPTAGERVAIDTVTSITLAAPWSVTVPDLSGLTPETAADRLREAAAELLESLVLPDDPPGLVIGSQSAIESDSPRGTVVDQTPETGQEAPLYGAVDISVAIPISANVPNLFGLGQDEAEATLEAAGLSLLRSTSRIDVAPAGTVIEQDPRASARVARGTAVSILLAEPILVRMPDLVSQTHDYAREVIASRGLILDEPTRRISEQPVDTVLEQSPDAQEMVPLNSAVQIVLAARVPNIVGMTPDEATPVLTSLGLALTEPPYPQEISSEASGVILRQDPQAGELADEGTVVAITVAARVPNIVGMTLEEAGVVLEEIGLQISGSPEERESDLPEGTIIEQNPAAGSAAESGDTVTVVVAIPVRVEVPSLLNRGVDAARALLEEVSLVLRVGEERPSSAPAGTVIEQSPVAGTLVPAGSTVVVVVAVHSSVGVLTGALGSQPDSLYVHATSMLSSWHVLQALYDGPYDQRRFSYQPIILEEVSEPEFRQVAVSTGGRIVRNGQITINRSTAQVQQMRITFRLREGIFWDDGEPVTARDSLLSFQLAESRITATSKFRVRRTEGYEVVDDLTVVWTGLPGWFDAAPIRNFWPPLPSHVLGDLAPDEVLHRGFGRRPSSYGPFTLLEWAEGERLILEQHPAYFRAGEGLPFVERLDLLIDLPSDQVAEMLLSGELDIALVGSISAEDIPRLEGAAEEGLIQLHTITGTGQEYLMLCLDEERTPFFLDVRVRQAIAMAIDRPRIIEELFDGRTEFGTSFMPRAHPFYFDDVRQYEFDPHQARELLEESGHPDGFELTLEFPAGQSDREKLAVMIASFLGDIGIRVKIEPVDPAQLFAKGPDSLLFGHRFDMAIFSWDGGVEPPAELFLSEEVSREENGWGAMNVSGYQNEEFDAAALRAMSEPNRSQQRNAWFQAQRIFAEDLPSIPLFQLIKVAATRRDFEGLSLDVSQPTEIWNIERFR